MKLHKLKKWQWITIAVLLLFIFTNPSLSSFKQYFGRDTKREYSDIRKEANFFLFSMFTHNENRYLAVLTNFIDVTPSPFTETVISKEEEPPVPSKEAKQVIPMSHEDSLDAAISNEKEAQSKKYILDKKEKELKDLKAGKQKKTSKQQEEDAQVSFRGN
jgi:hypothetical protein